MDKVYCCPRCGSTNVFAAYENRGAVLIIQAGCRDCGLLQQAMRQNSR